MIPLVVQATAGGQARGLAWLFHSGGRAGFRRHMQQLSNVQNIMLNTGDQAYSQLFRTSTADGAMSKPGSRRIGVSLTEAVVTAPTPTTFSVTLNIEYVNQ